MCISKLQSYEVTKNRKVTKPTELQSYEVTKLDVKKIMIPLTELNTCYYSPGDDKHSCCTHPYYCIFNPNRIRLDNNIHEIETELHQRLKDMEFIKHEGTSNSADYKTTKARIKYLNKDLKRLREFRNNIIEKEVKAYGYLGK